MPKNNYRHFQDFTSKSQGGRIVRGIRRVALSLFLFTFCSSLPAQVWQTQPRPTTGEVGGSAEFSIKVRVGGFSSIGIAVWKTGVGSVSSRFTVTSQSTSSVFGTGGSYTEGEYTLQTSNLVLADAGSYYFRVIVNSAYYASPDSEAVLLTVVTALPPRITNQSQASNVTVGSLATFAVTAGGNGLTYQWKKDGTDIAGATSATLSLSNVQLVQAGAYSVVVTNAGGSIASSSATLTVSNLSPSIATQPTAQAVIAGKAATFSVVASGTVPLAYQWRKDGTAISGATSSTYSISSTSTSDAGSYTVVVTNSVGSVTSSAAALTVSIPPSITTQPSASSVTVGNVASFSVVATGTAPLNYQWRKDGAAISGATSSTYTIASAKTTDAGSYTVIVANSAGSVTSSAATLTVNALPRLYSLAVRTALGANQRLIVGFTMSGGAKNVLLRAAGPTLGAFGVPETMVDPTLELYSGPALTASNDNWGGSPSLAATFTSAGAFAYASATSLDAALVASIDGGRTAHVYGPAAGAVLVEGYDVGSGDAQRFTSLSARNRVGTGANILIAGFSLAGEGKRNLLIRAVGPTLGGFGVPSVLADPKLEIYQGSTKIGENDNWAATLSTAFSSVGAFGLTAGSRDAAITVSLPAGGYTVQVSGADGGVGEALVEIYELP